MKSALLLSCCALANLVLPAAAWAQGSAPADVEERFDTLATARALVKTEKDARLLTTGSPNDRAVAGFSESNVQIEGEDEEQRLSVAFGVTLQGYRRQARDPGFFTVTRTKLAIVGSAPIGDDKAKVGFFSGDSLVNGGKVKISITRLSNVLGIGKGALSFLHEAQESCIRASAPIWLSHLPSGQRATGTTFFDRFMEKVAEMAARAATDQRGKSFELLIDNEMPDPPDDSLPAYLDQQCVVGPDRRFSNEVALLDAYGAKGEDFQRRFISDKSRLTFMGLDASIGSKDYEYLDRGGFKLASASKTSWEVGAYGGFLSADLTFSLRGRIVYGREVKLPDEATICHAVPGDPKEHCVTGPDGAPTRGKTGLASIETRHVLSIGPDTRIALAPQIAYRFKDKEFGAELPIYLAPDEKGALNGGVKLAYASKEDEFSIGLFIGVPFSIFYQ
jgi:hypothetical protein